jgi:hypothetical protein
MSQDLPSKQWSELSMFGRERMLCFVYGRRKMVLVSRPQESGSTRQYRSMGAGEITLVRP